MKSYLPSFSEERPLSINIPFNKITRALLLPPIGQAVLESSKKIINLTKRFRHHFKLTSAGSYLRMEGGYHEKVEINIWKMTLKCLKIHGWRDTQGFKFMVTPTDKFSQIFGYYLIKRMDRLKKLELHLKNERLTFRGLENFFSLISRNLILLKHLCIDISDECQNFNDEKLKKSMSQLFSNLTQLEHLEMDLCNSQITNKSLEVLGYKINHHLTNLRSLNLLFFRIHGVSGKGLRIGANLKNLKTLRLQFIRCDQINDEDLETICSHIQGLYAKLTCLSLYFECTEELSNKSFKSLSNLLVNGDNNLNQLELKFLWCPQVTDNGLKMLTFQTLNNLEKLILDFGGCKEITDDGLKNLIPNIGRNLLNLKSLSLSFGALENHFTSEITDRGLRMIAIEIIRNLRKLEALKLNFHSCTGITNKGLELVSMEVTRHLVKLQQLEFGFLWCENITDKGLELLASNFTNQTLKLQKLTLLFSEYGTKVTKECKIRLREKLLKYIPSVYIEV